MSPWALWLCTILLIGTGIAIDVPFVFDAKTSGVSNYTSTQLERAHTLSPDLIGVPTVTQAADNEVLAFPVTGGGGAPEGTTEKKVIDLKRTFDERLDTNNSEVLNTGAILAAKYPGDLTVDQICSIYDYLKNGDDAKNGWSYVRDRRGLDYYRYANESLKMGEKADSSGVGDCDDFAILMAAMVESIGGTTRIILARNNSTGGHAYSEVYLGSLSVQNNHIQEIIKWLEQKFSTNKIYTHIDTDTKGVWLNLDWGLDEKGNAHPGGPLYQGDKHIVLCLRDKLVKTPLKLSETVQVSRLPSEPVVTFPDPKLDAAIREAINKTNGTIYIADLDEIKFLMVIIDDIKNITGLEYCKNLETLVLSSNQITDVSPLSRLTYLEKLDLSSNRITDVSQLSGLTNLETLDLDKNRITDVSPLSGLTNLKTLDLSSNRIDLSLLSGLTNLETLDLDKNRITDVSLLSGLTNLETLRLAENQITDVSPLSGLTNLKTLRLAENQITDVSPLSGLTNLKTLDLSSNRIDLSLLSGLTNLETLDLDKNRITDVSQLSGLTNLKSLDLDRNQITDVSLLSGLTNLETLRLAENQITDIRPLSGLTNLKTLDLSSNRITDASPLSGLTKLETLDLDKTRITDVSPLSGLTNLESLDIQSTQITDVSLLSGLTKVDIIR